MNFKKLLFNFICVFFALSSYSYGQNTRTFTDKNIERTLTKYLDKQNVPEGQDSIVGTFYAMFSSATDSDKQIILNTLNYIVKKAITNSTIDIGTFTNKKNKTENFNKSIIYVFLETALFYKNKSSTSLYHWLLKADEMTNNPKTSVKNITDFIANTYFFTKGYLRKSNLINWHYLAKNYTLKYDEKSHNLEYSIPQTDLQCIYGGKDSLIIHKSKVVFNPLKDSLQVQSGTVKWQDRFGDEFKNSYVELNQCFINLKYYKYKASNAKYFNKTILRSYMTGDFEDGISQWAKKTAKMPKFISYKKNTELISDNKNFRFFGGLTVEGNKLQITGSNNIPAELHFYQNGKLFFKSQSLKMEFFSAKKSKITIYTGENDSIWHPACSYKINDKGFFVSRISKEKGNNLFQISDIKIETNMRSISWKAGSDSIKFLYGNLASINVSKNNFDFERAFEKNLSKANRTIFRSTNYFNAREFDRLKMYETRNPLFDIRNFCDKIGERTFTLKEYAGYIKKDRQSLKARLLDLSYKGFLKYDKALDKITVNQKLFDHLNYFTQKKDYDELEIVSPGTKDNWKKLTASYNLKNHTLNIGGVESVILSKVQKTAFRLDSTNLTIEKNRNMKFSGRLQAGLVQFVNGKYSFDYDKFEIKIDTAEQMLYSELRKDKNNRIYALPVTSTIYDISGTLNIDSAANKSGRFIKTGEEYPRFTTKQNSYVYYNEPGLANFNPKEFYFKIYPYTRRNLNYITAENLELDGEMHTGDMLPMFKETLTLIYDDYEVKDRKTNKKFTMNLASLGFVHDLQDNSTPLFNKGTFSKNKKGKSIVTLSRAGFKGEGKINWLTSEVQADEFNFIANNIEAHVANFTIKQDSTNSKYPNVNAKNVNLKWDAKNEQIICKTNDDEEQMNIFDGKVKLIGETIYTPTYLMGNGVAQYQSTELNSDSIIFKNKSYYTPNGSFKAYNNSKDKIDKNMLIETSNMRTYTDINAEKTAFENIDTSSYANIKSNLYKCYPKTMVWNHLSQNADINEPLSNHTSNKNTLKNSTPLDSTYMVNVANFSPSTFFGERDSIMFENTKNGLSFYGGNAKYVSNDKLIRIQEVERINVADISIFPSSEIDIKAKGVMNKLYKTKLKVINNENVVLHEITNVDIQIKSKNSYLAQSGTYKYKDITGKIQNVFFNKITFSEIKNASIATGTIKEEREFRLSPYYFFKGDIEFNAKQDYLTFNGFARIKNFCNYQGEWFYFKNEINPHDVVININKNLITDSARHQANVYADIKYAQDTSAIVVPFLKTAPDTREASLFSARKDLYATTYQPKQKRYIVAPLNSIADTLPMRNYMAYDTKKCIIKTNGYIDYAKLSHTKFNAFGSSSFDMRSKHFKINSFTMLDFWFNKNATEIMATTIKAQTPSKPVEITDEFKEKMEQSVGQEITEKYYKEQANTLPAPLDRMLVFSELKLHYNAEDGTFIASGDADLMGVKGMQINQKVSTLVKIRPGFKFDEMQIHISTNDSWFYFKFSDTNLYACSSNEDFNKAIEETKISKRKDPKSKLRYILGDVQAAKMFVNNF